MNYYNPNFNSTLNSNMPQFNLEQFQQVASTLDKTSLRLLVQKARQQGISDKDIEAGLNIILQSR